METKIFPGRPPRIPGFDYASAGAYFVTICSHNRENIFGSVFQDVVNLTPAGQIAAETWLWLGETYSKVHLDMWVLMPNHLHALIFLEDGCAKPLGRIIGAYKSTSTKRIRETLGMDGSVWQSSFYEHVVRSDKSLIGIRKYIQDNPAKWSVDRQNLDFRI